MVNYIFLIAHSKVIFKFFNNIIFFSPIIVRSIVNRISLYSSSRLIILKDEDAIWYTTAVLSIYWQVFIDGLLGTARWNNLPVTFEDPWGARSHEDVVPRNVDDRLWQQPIPENQVEGGSLLLVEKKRTIQALDTEEVPTPYAAKRSRCQGRRKSR